MNETYYQVWFIVSRHLGKVDPKDEKAMDARSLLVRELVALIEENRASTSIQVTGQNCGTIIGVQL